MILLSRFGVSQHHAIMNKQGAAARFVLALRASLNAVLVVTGADLLILLVLRYTTSAQ
jgi:hypothetical protein